MLSPSKQRRYWIAPAALIYAQLAHGFSWALLFWAAWMGNAGGLDGFAWIHTVALGWVTMAALAILMHALPNFIDVPWRGQTVARWSLVAYGAGVALLLAGFLGNVHLLAPAGDLLLAAIVVYLATAFWTLAGAMQRAVARAFGGTFLFLLATAIIGYGLAGMLSGRGVTWAASLPTAHAALGTLGWLSLLIFGVSMRTLRPITGQATRFRWMHIVVGSLALVGIPLLAAGVVWIGGALFAIAGIGYVFDVCDVLRRATVTHRPPQAFVAAALVWFLIALAIGGGVLAGEPWQRAYIFVLLIGWIGQMVNAHVYHIGIRLLATIYRGEDDETRPQELLEARLSWFSFLAFQAGIAIVVVALLLDRDGLVARGAVFGFAGWLAMVANILAARIHARSPITA